MCVALVLFPAAAVGRGRTASGNNLLAGWLAYYLMGSVSDLITVATD